MRSCYPSSNGSAAGHPAYDAAMSRLLYGGSSGLLGLWLWDKKFCLPKEHLGARVHALWIMRLKGEQDVLRHYAGFVVLPGIQTLTQQFKSSLQEIQRETPVKVRYRDLRAAQYLEDPLCGDIGSFPLPQDGRVSTLAKKFITLLSTAGHDLAALDPALFRDPNAFSSSGSPPRS